MSATSESAIKEKPSDSNLSSSAFGSSRARPILGPPQPIPLIKIRNEFFWPPGWAPFNLSAACFEMWIIFPPPFSLVKSVGFPLRGSLLPRPRTSHPLIQATNPPSRIYHTPLWYIDILIRPFLFVKKKFYSIFYLSLLTILQQCS